MKKLYPSLDVAFAVEKVRDVFYTSDVQVRAIDVEELGLYLTLNGRETELGNLRFLRFCPTCKTN